MSHQLKPQLAANNAGGAHQDFQRRATVLGIEQAINLRASSVHQPDHARLGNTLLFHLVRDLPGDDGRDGGGRYLLTDTGLVEPALEGRSDTRIFFLVMMTPSAAATSIVTGNLGRRRAGSWHF